MKKEPRWLFGIDDSLRNDDPKADAYPFIESPAGKKLWLAMDADLVLAKEIVHVANLGTGFLNVTLVTKSKQ